MWNFVCVLNDHLGCARALSEVDFKVVKTTRGTLFIMGIENYVKATKRGIILRNAADHGGSSNSELGPLYFARIIPQFQRPGIRLFYFKDSDGASSRTFIGISSSSIKPSSSLVDLEMVNVFFFV